MSTLTAAVAFLKGAVDRRSSSTGTPTYMFHDGWAYARAPAVAAGHPVPCVGGTFGLSADELDAALGRMKSEPTLSPGDGAMVLRSGRLRSSVDLFDVSPDDAPEHPHAALAPVPPTLVAALALALPYTSAQRNWTCSVLIEPGRVLAINGPEGVAVDVPDLSPPAPVALTDATLKYITALDPPPTHWLATPASVTFGWPSGAFVRCQVMSEPWAAAAFGAFEKMGALPTPVAITPDLVEAVADLASLDDSHLDLTPTSLTGRGKSQHADHAAELDAGEVPPLSRWRIDSLQRLVSTATHWAPSPDTPAPFSAPGVRGFVCPLRLPS